MTKEEHDEISFDGIKLPKKEGENPHIPKNAKKFIDHQNILKTIALGIKEDRHVLIIGESGAGKTSAVRYLAQETNTPLRRINLNGGTTADELVGRNGINEGGTYWIDGILTECMRNGYWLILDEINAALAEVTFVLHSLLDDDGYIVLTEKPDREIVKRHPNFRIFATCNPPDYAGTKELNTALLSRFHICIYTEFPDEKTEKKIIEEHLGTTIANHVVTEKLLKLANDTRANKIEEKNDYCINTRDVINTLTLCTTYVPKEAIKLAFGNKLNKEDKKSFETISSLQLTDAKINLNEFKIKKTEDLYNNDTKLHLTEEITGKKLKKVSETTPLGEILIEKHETERIKGETEFECMGFYEKDKIGITKTPTKQENILATIIKTEKGEYLIPLSGKELIKKTMGITKT